jgi:diguanylate cyclase (GGDEF)-like protein
MSKLELLAKIASDPQLPTPSSVALRVLEKASQPDCTIGDLTAIISMDAGLSGKILKTVNSAVFGFPRAVTTIQRALAVLGIKSARSLVLTLSLPEMQKHREPDERTRRYWKTSVAGAIIAKELSVKLKRRDPEEDLSAGLLRDLGELILEHFFREKYQTVLDASTPEYLQRQCALEETACGVNHAEVTAFLLNKWRLPDETTDAILHHHDPAKGVYRSEAVEQRAYMLQFASKVAHLLAFPGQVFLYRELLDLAKAKFGMEEASVNDFLEPLTDKIELFASILKVDIGKVEKYPVILASAAQELVNLTLAINLDNHRYNEQKRRAESEARRWRQVAVVDPLTQAFNRRFLEERLQEIFTGPEGMSEIGLLFIDLDGFKPLNDRFGHAFGDKVLQEVAYTLRQQVRADDMVARFGGDEFCIVAVHADRPGLQVLAQRVWQSINDLTVRFEGKEGKVGASIGGLTLCPQTVGANPDELLAASDKAMYAAKRLGRNRVHLLDSLQDAAALPSNKEAVARV